MFATALEIIAVIVAGAALWTLAEYLLHRFAMHALNGKGIMSREHLEHHVTSSWSYSHTTLLSWAGVIVVGTLLWAPIGWLILGLPGLALGLGWVIGYAGYEHQHAMAHLKGPQGRYSTWLRRHHFHHHFGHPKSNHGVTSPVWDRVFGTYESPEQVRVPRRLALPWMLDDGELRADLAQDYVLVGSADRASRAAQLDRARAFASIAPAD